MPVAPASSMALSVRVIITATFLTGISWMPRDETGQFGHSFAGDTGGLGNYEGVSAAVTEGVGDDAAAGNNARALRISRTVAIRLSHLSYKFEKILVQLPLRHGP